jgi:hypothetical protein
MNHIALRILLFVTLTLVSLFGWSSVGYTQELTGQAAASQTALSSAFTYQGVLQEGGNPANGAYDFQFKLYDAATGGNQVGGAITTTVTVNAGQFTVKLDFGAAAFRGEARYLEIGVRPAGSTNPYTILTPRQELTAAPYALYSLSATSTFALAAADGDPAQAVFVDPAGRVGIGVLNPREPLHVNNKILVSGKNPGTLPILQFDKDDLEQWQVYLSDTNSHLVFRRGPSPSGAHDVMLIRRDNGYVGIGEAFTPAFPLHVNGAAAKPGGGSWSDASDARLKEVQGQFTRGLEALAQLTPVYYHYKAGNPLQLPSEDQYVGLIAQEVEQVIPEAVEKERGDYLYVNNDPILWTMLNAIKELKAEKEAMQQQNTALEARLAALEAQVTAPVTRPGGWELLGLLTGGLLVGVVVIGRKGALRLPPGGTR